MKKPMKKFFYAAVAALALCGPAAAQTSTPAARPQTPAATRPTPQPQRPATSPTTAPAAAQAPAQPSAADLCGCEPGPMPAVVATAGGVRLTPSDFSQQTLQQIERLKQEVIGARKNELNLQINSILLDAEAKKRGITTAKLLEDEVIAKTVNPTDADAQKYFEANRARLEGQAGRRVELAEVKENVLNFLRGQRQEERARVFSEQLRAANDVKVLVPEATPPASAADRSRLLATVNGQRITSGDVEDSLLPLVAAVQKQVYALRRNDLEMKINDLLLEREAQKRGITARAVLDAEVSTKVPVVNETQAQAFYNQNKERINGEFAQIKYQIIEYLQEQEKTKLSSAFAERLRQGAGVQIFLAEPVPPTYKIATDGQPSKGNPNAAVTVIEFTDFQCPSCAQSHPAVERLMAEYGDRVHFVVRDFPLAQHADAPKAAEAAEAAREQGKYWEYIAILYRNQSALSVANLKQYATTVGLDRARFDAALDSGKYAEAVRRDIRDGERVGVNGTPSFFINGRRTDERTYEGLKSAVEAALKAPAK
jgi:protein-disulfide isomerase